MRRLLFALVLLACAGPAVAQVPPGPFVPQLGGLGPVCPGIGAMCRAVPSFNGPGDVAGASFAEWWGMRAFNGATAGTKSILIRRASDNTTQTINTLSNGNLDVASATTFCTATSCFVVTWFDKVGTNDVTQSTNAEQWALTFNCDGTLPCATAQTTDGARYQTAGSFSVPQPYSAACEMKEDSNGIGNPATCVQADGGFFALGLDSGNAPQITAGVELASAAQTLPLKLAMAAVVNTSPTASLNWNGTVITGNAGTNTIGGTTLSLGFAGSTTFHMFEAGVANVAWSTATRDAIEANLAAYW